MPILVLVFKLMYDHPQLYAILETISLLILFIAEKNIYYQMTYEGWESYDYFLK